MKKPSSVELTVFHQIKASHSLLGFEVPHFHLWKVAVTFCAPLPIESDRLIDLVYLQSTLNELFSPLEGVYLNTALSFSPTSEKLAEWIWDQVSLKIAQTELSSVSVTLCDLDGNASGVAKVMA